MKVEFDQAKVEQAIVDQAVSELLNSNIEDSIHDEIKRQVTEALNKNLNSRIEKTLNEIMKQARDTEMCPVNVWGEREGKPTTLRVALHDRAQAFWQEKVNSEGKRESYGGKPRYEHALSVITAKEFDSAIKQNIVNIAGAIKDAVRADFYKVVDTQLNDFFKIKSIGDKGSKA
jgi:hypothetical protein